MKKNNKILLASMLAAGFAVGGTAALNINTASATQDVIFQGVNVNSLVMSKGASVRVADENYGIRFQMNLDEEAYLALEEKDASYGIAIFPADYGYAITEAAIFAPDSKATLVESPVLSDADEDGTYDMWGSLVNINPDNITREFIGIGYIKVGEEYKLAQAFDGDAANNTRSIYYVAQLLQEAAEVEGATDEEKAIAEKVKEFYLDTFTANYAYTINHVYQDKTGKVINTEKETVYAPLNSVVNATPRANGWYKYDAAQSTMSGKLYANGKTTFTAVYTDNSYEATYNAKYVKQNGTEITLDATKFGVELKGLEKVFVDGKEVTVTPVSQTEISIPAATGVHQIAVYDGDKCYYGDLTVADYEIKDQASFAAMSDNKSTYAVVTTDITCDGTTIIAPCWHYVDVIDGLGHTITNAFMKYGFGQWRDGLSYNMSAGDAIKNINFVNLKMGDGEYPLLGQYVGGGASMENVNMSITIPGRNWSKTNWQALFCNMFTGEGDARFVMKNVAIDINMTKESDRNTVWRLYSDAKGYYGTIFENVSIKTNGKLAMVGEGWYGSTDPQLTLTKSSWTNVMLQDKDRKVRYGANVVEYAAEYLLVSDGKVTLDATKVEAQLAGVEKVYVDGVEVAFTPVSATQISIPATVGAHEFAIYDGTAMYYATITVADYEIKDVASFAAMNAATSTYAVVTNDFTCDNTVIAPHWGCTNVIDGLGHTITNANMPYGFGMWNANNQQNMTAADSIRNINFVNLKMGSGEYPLLAAYVAGSVIENVNMSIIVPGRNWTHSWQGLFCKNFTGEGDGRAVVRNVNIDITMTNEADCDKVWRLYDDAKAYYGTIFENVTIKTNGLMAKVGEGWYGSTDPQITLTKSSWTNVKIIDKRDQA